MYNFCIKHYTCKTFLERGEKVSVCMCMCELRKYPYIQKMCMVKYDTVCKNNYPVLSVK